MPGRRAKNRAAEPAESNTANMAATPATPANSAVTPSDPGRSYLSLTTEGDDDDTEQLPRLPKKAGRPGRPLDHQLLPDDERGWETLDGLIRLQCTLEEVAAFFGRSEEWVRNRVKDRFDCTYGQYADQIRPLGLISLRRKQMQLAMSGDRQMLIFLGQNHLGQSTKAKTELTGKDGGAIQTEDVTDPARIVLEGLATIASRQAIAQQAREQLAGEQSTNQLAGPPVKTIANTERADMDTIKARVRVVNTPPDNADE